MDREHRSRLLRLVLASSVVFMGLAQATTSTAPPPASYTVQDLGALAGDSSSVGLAINEIGDVVGWSMGANGTRAFVFTDAVGMVALPGLANRPRTVARDINNAGVIVGSANAGGGDIGHAVLWSAGAIRDLGTLPGGYYSEASGVNTLGQVVGWSDTNAGSMLLGVHGFLYDTSANTITDLTPNADTGYAEDINDAGQVTGYQTAFGGYHAFRWQGGNFLDLGVLPGFAHSIGWAINAFGDVAGNSTSASGNSERLFRYSAGFGLQDLGGTGQHNTALGLNSAGHVVGFTGNSAKRALRYTDANGLQDLNTLIDPSLGWVLLAAYDINDLGQIVGYAFNNFTGQTHAVRLLPQAGPPPECSFRCLRSSEIVLTGRLLSKKSSSYGITAKVTVRDENAATVSGGLVVGRWTLPDGGTFDANAWTDSAGVAAFAIQGGEGLYNLTIVNIVRSLYTFNPSASVLSRSIVLPVSSFTPSPKGSSPRRR